MRTGNMKKYILLTIVLAITIVLAGIIYYADRDQRTTLSLESVHDIHDVQSLLEAQLADESDKMLTALASIARDEQLVAAQRAGDRHALNRACFTTV